MAITSDDIKLMQPERLTDNEDGGGMMTGREVIDGDINNLFEDISRVNRTYGNVSVRKAFLKVDTDTSDLYLDAHSILSAQPADPRVTGLLFSTESHYDERDAARQRIESFVVAGPETQIYLRGTQLKGQRALIVYAPKDNSVRAPEVGETYMLQTGTALASQQFVKVMEVEHTEEVFTYFVGGETVRTFKADQYVLQLSAELARDYAAKAPHPFPDNQSRLYSTQPATSAKYYGSTRLLTDAAPGATSIRVIDTFAPIIPTASNETPVIDQRPGGFLPHPVRSADDPISIAVNVEAGSISEMPTAIFPGTVSIVIDEVLYTDSGGEFLNEAQAPGALQGTTINYTSGVISWAGTASGASEVGYVPAAAREHVPNTGTIDITDANRNFNYVLQLDPPPAPLAFHASYQYLGKWYDLSDNGTGQIVGDGSGQVNYDTGSVVITTLAQPDANSKIFFRWLDGGLYSVNVDAAYSLSAPITLKLNVVSVSAGSVTISWSAGGIGKSATDSSGVISGDATGKINYASGEISLFLSETPDGNFTVSYNSNSIEEVVGESNAIPANLDKSNITLSSTANAKPGSVRFSIRKTVVRNIVNQGDIVVSSTKHHQTNALHDDGNGAIIDSREGAAVGSINYTTGAITVNGGLFLKTYNEESPEGRQSVVSSIAVSLSGGSTGNTPGDEGRAWRAAQYKTDEISEVLEAQTVVVYHTEISRPAGSGSRTLSPTQTPWKFYLLKFGPLVPGSIVLDIGGDLWFDDGLGNLLTGYSTATGIGTVRGTVDYSTTEVVIDWYEGRPASALVKPVSILTGDDIVVLEGVLFRTSAAPLRPNGFTVRARDIQDDTLYNAAADAQGDLSGDGITGAVDLQRGLAELAFPAPVLASTVFYNAVSYKSVPLDSRILGLDPVRLPADGRVPILRDADILVLTHTARDIIEGPEAGMTVSAGRDKLHDAWIEDESGARLAAAQYSLDKETGTAVLSTPFSAIDDDGQPLSGSLYFVHRIDEMSLCTEARIDGRLQLAQPLYHEFPAAETWVASAVYLGDLRARVKSWNSYVSDPAAWEASGTPTAAQYNDNAYPIAIDNRGAVSERWKIRFTSTTSFVLIGEHMGQIATGSIVVDFSPTNPQTGTPFFTIQADGWGSGWAVGNTVRFDTEGASAPLWLIRTVLPGMASVNDDQLKIELRGDHN